MLKGEKVRSDKKKKSARDAGTKNHIPKSVVQEWKWFKACGAAKSGTTLQWSIVGSQSMSHYEIDLDWMILWFFTIIFFIYLFIIDYSLLNSLWNSLLISLWFFFRIDWICSTSQVLQPHGPLRLRRPGLRDARSQLRYAALTELRGGQRSFEARGCRGGSWPAVSGWQGTVAICIACRGWKKRRYYVGPKWFDSRRLGMRQIMCSLC